MSGHSERTQARGHEGTKGKNPAHPSPSGAGALLVALLASALAAAADPEVASLKLRAQATVCSDTVTLGDVLEFGEGSEPLVERIAQEPIVAGRQTPGLTTVIHEQIAKRLDELGVNVAQVLLGGALQCRILRPTTPQSSRVAQDTPTLLRAPTAAASTGPRTLADVLRAHVDAELAELGGTAEISFERAGQEFLQLTTPPWEFHVSSNGREKLGLREFHVAIRREGQAQRKAVVLAQVHLVRPVVVARRPLNPGNFVRSDDVGLETRVFEQGGNRGPTRTEEVVGQQVEHFVPAGEPVAVGAIKAGDLVVRTRPVTITGNSAGIQVRLTGIALDSGGYGDTVRVRLGDSRRERKLLQGVVTGLGTVRLAEGSPQ